MKRQLVYLTAVLLLLVGVSLSQSTTVSGTLADSNGQAAFNTPYTIVFTGPPNSTWSGGPLTTSYTGTTNGSGVFSQSLPSNTAISPAGSGWTFTFCPPASVPCSTFGPITVTGTTQNITSSIVLPAIVLPPSNQQRAYTDAEVQQSAAVLPGAFYWNLTSNLSRQWTGSAWANFGGGGGGFTAGGDLSGTSSSQTVIGINNTLLSGLSTGLLKITTGTGVPSIGTSTDVISLFTSCSGTQYLGADGACHSISGGITLQTNTVNNSSQTTLNLVNSTAFNGLTFTFTNTSGGIVTAGFSGTLGNGGLTNSATTVNSQTCTLGSTCTIPFQTIGSGNTSQAGVNFIASTTNSTGLTVTPSNPGTNQEKFEVAGTLVSAQVQRSFDIMKPGVCVNCTTGGVSGVSITGSYSLSAGPVTPYGVAGTSTTPGYGVPKFTLNGVIGTGSTIYYGPYTLPTNYPSNGNITVTFATQDSALGTGTVTFGVTYVCQGASGGAVSPTFFSTGYTSVVTLSASTVQTNTATITPNTSGSSACAANNQIFFGVWLNAVSASQTPVLFQLYGSY